MKYRPEVDGLRTVAVVPVILFHAGFSVVSGGFVGVDVFFVISGYLITTLLLLDIEKGSFSILNFYERRIRRIFPALFLVVLCCIPVAWMLMLPDQLKDFSQSVAAVILFLSNVLFWEESGYFAEPSELKPLLHTWSLAVEEQYYVFFPLLLAFLWPRGRKLTIIVLVALTLASLLATEWGWRFARSANFYLTPFRIWELLAGSLCAIALHYRQYPGNNLLGLAGLAMITYAIFAFDKSTPFPSFYTLIPVVGTCLCILFVRPGTIPSLLLSSAPFVGIGLISYSAYLWHQPLFAFTRLASPLEPSMALMMFLSLLSLGLAYLTWRFIEQPFRRRDVGMLSGRRTIFALATVSGVALMAVGTMGHVRDGFPERFDPRLKDILAIPLQWWPKRDTCQVDNEPPVHPVAACVIPGDGPDIQVALIGDSHSLSIATQVQDDLQARGITSYSVSMAGCIGLSNFYRVDLDANHECERYNAEYRDFMRQAGIETVILTSRFPLYVDGDRFDNGEGGLESGEPTWIDLGEYRGQSVPRSDPARRARVLKQYRDGILELLEEMNVVLVYPIPEAGWDVFRYAVRESVKGNLGNLNISTDQAAYETRVAEVEALFDAIEHPRLKKVRPDAVLCDTFYPGRCINANGYDVYYRDEDHVSFAGAELLAPSIGDAVEELAR